MSNVNLNRQAFNIKNKTKKWFTLMSHKVRWCHIKKCKPVRWGVGLETPKFGWHDMRLTAPWYHIDICNLWMVQLTDDAHPPTLAVWLIPVIDSILGTPNSPNAPTSSTSVPTHPRWKSVIINIFKKWWHILWWSECRRVGGSLGKKWKGAEVSVRKNILQSRAYCSMYCRAKVY